MKTVQSLAVILTAIAGGIVCNGPAAAQVLSVPINGIIMWYGSPTNLPPGFELCDGQETTGADGIVFRKPNLINRFAMGVSNSGDLRTNNISGGSDPTNHTVKLTITKENLPEHYHDVAADVSRPKFDLNYEDIYMTYINDKMVNWVVDGAPGGWPKFNQLQSEGKVGRMNVPFPASIGENCQGRGSEAIYRRDHVTIPAWTEHIAVRSAPAYSPNPAPVQVTLPDTTPPYSGVYYIIRVRESDAVPPHDVISGKELLIISNSIVDDDRATNPNGAWHFATIMKRLAGSQDDAVASKFVIDWMTAWDTNRSVNGDAFGPRPGITTLLSQWRSSANPALLDWSKTPFRLLAIVNRIDLTRFSDVPNRVVKNLGEGRLVYGLANGSSDFTLIVEFKLPSQPGADLSKELEQWARAWHSLGTSEFGGPADFDDKYKDALQKITDLYAQKDNLNQLRSNEIRAGSQWELREFKLIGGDLKQVPVAQTPDFDLNNKADLANWITQEQQKIIDGTYEVPLQFPAGQSFLGGFAPNPSASTEWSAAVTNTRAVKIFSFNTCMGCHGNNASGGRFQHIVNVPAGSAAPLSVFLTSQVNLAFLDPANPLHDEMKIRAAMLSDFAGESKAKFSGAQLLEQKTYIDSHCRMRQTRVH